MPGLNLNVRPYYIYSVRWSMAGKVSLRESLKINGKFLKKKLFILILKINYVNLTTYFYQIFVYWAAAGQSYLFSSKNSLNPECEHEK